VLELIVELLCVLTTTKQLTVFIRLHYAVLKAVESSIVFIFTFFKTDHNVLCSNASTWPYIYETLDRHLAFSVYWKKIFAQSNVTDSSTQWYTLPTMYNSTNLNWLLKLRRRSWDTEKQNYLRKILKNSPMFGKCMTSHTLMMLLSRASTFCLWPRDEYLACTRGSQKILLKILFSKLLSNHYCMLKELPKDLIKRCLIKSVFD